MSLMYFLCSLIDRVEGFDIIDWDERMDGVDELNFVVVNDAFVVLSVDNN